MGRYVLIRRIIAAILDYTLLNVSIAYTQKYLFPGFAEGYIPDTTEVLEFFSLNILLIILFWFFLFPFAEYMIGGTVFKRLFLLKVVSQEGGDISFLQAIKRRLADFADMQILGLVGLIVILTNYKRSRLGDMWAKTQVLDSKIRIT